jgi:putative intracellular protease/amidase
LLRKAACRTSLSQSRKERRYGVFGDGRLRCECLDDEERQTSSDGVLAEEFVTPHRKFSEAGLKVTVASPGGVAPTVDPLSFNLAYNSNDANKVQDQQAYMKRLGSALTSPMRVENIDPDRFDVIFLVGGHGPMQDMAVHPTTGAVLVAMLDNPKKLVAAVCHGPAGLLPASRPDGTWALKDRQLTGFSNEEETQAGFARKRAVALGRSPPYFWGALHRKSTLDAACRRRRQPHHGSAELFSRCNS